MNTIQWEVFMLFLFNKSKIISYVVSVFTVIALLFIANTINFNFEGVQVTANVVENDRIIDK